MTFGANMPVLFRQKPPAPSGFLSYDSKNVSVATQTTSPRQCAFKSDGTKMYVNSGSVFYQYSLSSAWDVSTATYDSVSFSMATQSTGMYGICFKPDGTKFYAMSLSNMRVYEYNLATPWSLSTASYASLSKDTSAQTPFGPITVQFKPDGTKMYVGEQGATYSVYEYTLSSAWDVSTATYSGNTFDYGANVTILVGMCFNSTGTILYISDDNVDKIFKYSLSAWDITTSAFVASQSIAAQDTSVIGIALKTDDTKMYLTGNANDKVFQYSVF